MKADPVRDELLDEKPSRYVFGIDLGTTNSAVCYVDTSVPAWQVTSLAVQQLVAPAEVEARRTLPSFHYEPAEGSLADDALRLPWSKTKPDHAVGFFARDDGALVPGRLITSAKSWLCHTGVDRTTDLLPWHGTAEVTRLSPVEVSARYLRHIRDAWDFAHPREPLAEQDVVLTLPASFDEVARELTVEAAARAGLPRVVLIEEPQAAFYAWIYANRDRWDQLVEAGQKILVCDIGGGTSDFTLIRVRRGEGGTVVFHRVAVGQHLILGGDNLDLALAHHVEKRLTDGGKLPPRQWAVLVRLCQKVKETLLGAGAPERTTVALPGAGAKLIGGAQAVELTRDEVRALLVDGFLPRVALNDKPQVRGSGFQEFGLPYAPDPAITRYLAAFLTTHRHVTVDDDPLPTDHDPARPDVVLFNGGLFESPVLRDRLHEVLRDWFRDEQHSAWQPLVLQGDALDLAVARGAAYYGMVRRGEGVRIAAGLARTYYIGVQSQPPAAVCLVPASVEPGNEVNLTERQFELIVSRPVEFPLYVSSTRLTDRPGDLVPIDREQMTPLPPIRTVLRTRRKNEPDTASVTLHARLTEIGTVDLWCSDVERERSWRLQFDVRSATQTDVTAHQGAGETEGFVDESTWQKCYDCIDNTFGDSGSAKPQQLVKSLADAVGLSRDDWPMSLLRRIWDTLREFEPARRRSPTHEARWLNLLGYALRPGYGVALDDWRVAETWRALQGKVVHGTAQSRSESWILWRRIAGGLGAGQQRALADPLLASVRSLHRRATTGRGGAGDFSFSAQESAELWRLLGSLELLPVPVKIELGNMLLDLWTKPKLQPVRAAIVWTVGRVGARVPVYGPLNCVVPADVVAKWIDQLLKQRELDATGLLAVMQLARRSNDRYRDLPEKKRLDIASRLEASGAPAHYIALVRDGGQLDAEEQGKVFGEALPVGLRIA